MLLPFSHFGIPLADFMRLLIIANSDKIPAIKYLGVYFDENLNFKYHVSHLSNKLSRALYSLRSAKNLLPLKSLKTLYFSLFHCHLIYAIEIWSSAPSSALQPLIIKQKTAIRIVANKKYNDRTEPLFKELSILPLPDLIISFNLKFFHSYVFNYIPTAFLATWQTAGQTRENSNYQLRNDNEYYIPRHRTEQLARMLFFTYLDCEIPIMPIYLYHLLKILILKLLPLISYIDLALLLIVLDFFVHHVSLTILTSTLLPNSHLWNPLKLFLLPPPSSFLFIPFYPLYFPFSNLPFFLLSFP
jgi:hypothetical protein